MPPKSSTGKTKSIEKKRRSSKGSQKLDLYTKHKNEYVASRLPTLVKVGPAKYLAITGKSTPGDDQFQNAVGALYTVAFTIKMARKLAGSDYMVTKLEGQYWLDAGMPAPTPGSTGVWNWQLMLRVPPFITEKERATSVEELVTKGKPVDVRRVQLVELDEGSCVQILHLGPYTEETPSIEKMREFAAQLGKKFTGRHHEIYVTDPRRVKPDKLKTILRNPIA
jgi:hypothetical protein